MGAETHILERFGGRKFSLFFAFRALLVLVIFVSFWVAIWRYNNTSFPTIGPKSLVSSFAESSSHFLLSKESKPISFYTDLTASRDIFRFGSADAGIAPAVAVTLPAVGDFAGRYILQGIILDKNPQAIIKDTQSSKTYFVHPKEMLDAATLQSIEGNRVIFDLQGQSVELIKK